jgi:hypothetical protein
VYVLCADMQAAVSTKEAVAAATAVGSHIDNKYHTVTDEMTLT